MSRGEDGWPREFTARLPGGYTVREAVVARDTPLGMGRPRCAWCGNMIRGVAHAHHLYFRGRLGDGRPSNGVSLCPDEAGGCHAGSTGVHTLGVLAAGRGFARPGGWPRPEAYAAPLRCAWRGWIVLDDDGGWRAAAQDEVDRWFPAPCPDCAVSGGDWACRADLGGGCARKVTDGC